MKKAIKFTFIAIVFIILLSISSFAYDLNSYTFYYPDRQVTIESTYLSEEDAHKIADSIVFGITPVGNITPGSTINTPLLCILFGHSIETSKAFETIHNAYPTSPKCVINEYDIEICTRNSCDYIQKTLVESTRISYCHG